jgi:hypothetical protein
MRKIVLISCVRKKRSCKSKAKDLYLSPLFIKSLKYAHKLTPDAIFILSAKYGLLDLNMDIEPYNLTLNSMSASDIRLWADMVLRQLSALSDFTQDHFIFLAGMKYRKYLMPHLCSIDVPLAGLPIGKQLQYLSR